MCSVEVSIQHAWMFHLGGLQISRNDSYPWHGGCMGLSKIRGAFVLAP